MLTLDLDDDFVNRCRVVNKKIKDGDGSTQTLCERIECAMILMNRIGTGDIISEFIKADFTAIDLPNPV